MFDRNASVGVAPHGPAGIGLLDIAEDFVLVSFALLFGALCLAMALAFGLGSREVAAEIVREQAIDASAESHRQLMTEAGKRDIAMLVPVVFAVLPTVVMVSLLPTEPSSAV